jgi:hypothetical protein
MLPTLRIESDPCDQASEPLNPVRITTMLELDWETPGSMLARRLEEEPAVRYVFEHAGDSWGILVLVSDDRGEILDKVFDAERELYVAFPRTRLDVRVTKTEEGWTPDYLHMDPCRLARP